LNLLEFLFLLLIAGVCGSIGQSLAGVSRRGCLSSIALGFVGALLGAWIARALSLPELFQFEVGDTPFPVIWSIIGSALFVAVLGALSRDSRRSKAK